MSKDPFLIDDILSEPDFRSAMKRLQILKNVTPKVSDINFNREFFHDDPFFIIIHHKLTEKACRLFGEKLKPSYSFVSMYSSPESICPLHIDRAQCYRTIDLCLEQREVWPLYVNSNKEIMHEYCTTVGLGLVQKTDTPFMQKVLETSTRYDMKPGQALCYSGTDHPHWRKKINPGNFCDLIFFHFVPIDFEGPLA